VTKTFLTALVLTALNAAAQGSLADIPLPPTDAEQKQIVAAIKAKALEYDKTLPDFACLQLSHHSIDAKSMNQWKTLETVSEQLRFVNHEQQYTLVAQNGKKASGSEKRPSNLVSIKEFSDLLHDIFDPKVKADFIWTQWEAVRGHRVHMLTFGLKKETSTFTIGGSKGIAAGLAGFIYADSETNAVLRIATAATEVPPKYSIQGTSLDFNYDFIRVGDKIHLLPLKADLRSKDGKAQIWDEVELKDFRKP
jgi:hypothetical protein